MKNSLLASALIVGFVTPALAEQFACRLPIQRAHKCSMMHTIPVRVDEEHGRPLRPKLGPTKAMQGMKECTA